MGILDIFRARPAYSVAVGAAPLQPVSPWETSNAQTLIWAQHFNIPDTEVTRQTAMQVPAIARARALILGSIADLPFVVYEDGQPVSEQPGWIARTGSVMSPWHRWAATLDDLLFYGVSLWVRLDGDLAHCPAARWSTDALGRISVDGRVVSADEVVVIPGPGEGLLATAVHTIRGARSIEKSWQARVRTPIPGTLFKATEEDPATDEEIQTLLNKWANARRDSEDAGVGYVPYGLEPVFAPGGDDSQLFIEGRNAIRLDVANHVNIPASLLDGSTATASLTYVTQEGQRSSFHEQTLRWWTAPLEHRLSMDDVMPQGQYGRFDITYHTPVAPEGEPSAD